MNIKFDYEAFKDWYNLNGMSRSKVLQALGQRDPNKVGRWILGQVINTEDLIGICNHYNLKFSDFFIYSDEEEGERIETVLPDRIKNKRKMLEDRNEENGNYSDISSPPASSTSSMTADDFALAKLSLKYEQRINNIVAAHNQEIKESRAITRQHIESRDKIISSLQDTISVQNKSMERHEREMEDLLSTISMLKNTIQAQQNTIATYDAIIRKQKKIPSPHTPDYSGSATMVNDGGGVISTAPPSE